MLTVDCGCVLNTAKGERGRATSEQRGMHLQVGRMSPAGKAGQSLLLLADFEAGEMAGGQLLSMA